MENYCEHLDKAHEAHVKNVKADEFQVTISKLKSLKLDESDIGIIEAASKNSSVTVYILHGTNIAVPSLFNKSHDNPLEFLHLRNLECPLNSCKERRSKLHTLMKKDRQLCLHSLLGHCVPSTLKVEDSASVLKEKTKAAPKIERDLTVNYIYKQIQEHFPTMCDKTSSTFLARNLQYTTSLLQRSDISAEINSHVRNKCTICLNTKLKKWPFQHKKSFLLSMGALREIEIDVKTCPNCRIAYYPDLYSKGLFPLHNKLLMSYDLLMDLYNLLVTGSSLVANIEAKFILLGRCNGYDEEHLRTNLSNNAKDIEKMAIATIASLGRHTMCKNDIPPTFNSIYI